MEEIPTPGGSLEQVIQDEDKKDIYDTPGQGVDINDDEEPGKKFPFKAFRVN